MLAGLAPFRLLRSDLFRRALRRAVRLGVMLGPMIGPLASSAAGAELFPTDPWAAVADAASIDGLTGVGDAARWRRASSWAASGAEFASFPSAAEASAELAAGTATIGEREAVEPAPALAPALLALAAPGAAPREERAAAAELDWLSGAGLAVHPVRSVAVAATPRLPGVVAAPAVPVQVAEGTPALAAPEPPPVFAALLPAEEPASGRLPLIAAKPASPAVRAARRAGGTRLVETPARVIRTAGAPRAVADAVARFLAATAPGAWSGMGTELATPAARTAGADNAAGTDGTAGPLRQ
ncbi:hypothetical protein [Alienimonas sp. DA493]|uniref:hypothetical protein n=1 Tax=Alienimonas sp. DA493 TaxID=3373605 RepID=UPI0037544FBD